MPRKNLREVSGRPLLAWTIGQALAARTPDGAPLTVVVSTEDAEIAALARAEGATVIDRPVELAGHTTATEPVVEHALAAVDASMDAAGGPRHTWVLLLQATSPVRHPGTIDRAIAQAFDSGVDSLVGVVPASPFLWRGHPEVTPAYDVARRPLRQDFAPGDEVFRETGSLYLTRREIYEREHNRIGGQVGLFVMAADEGLDIDTEDDLQVAAALLGRG